MKLAALVFCMSAAGLAESWSGLLVDGRCWTSSQTNVSEDTTSPNRDMSFDVRACRPTDDTKKFMFVSSDWRGFKLDPAGNARAAQLIGNGQSHRAIHVSIKGALSKRTIRVTSMSLRADSKH